MKKTTSFLFFLLVAIFLLNSCVLLPRKKTSFIQWPAEIRHMEAVCELNIAWNNKQYSGDMSIKLRYPDTLFLEVYGPFGDTVFSIEKEKDSLAIRAGNDRLTSEKHFSDMFNMTVNDLIDDLSMKGTKQYDSDGTFYILREQHRVTYYLGSGEDKICWTKTEGTMCIRFLEVSFDKGTGT